MSAHRESRRLGTWSLILRSIGILLLFGSMSGCFCLPLCTGSGGGGGKGSRRTRPTPTTTSTSDPTPIPTGTVSKATPPPAGRKDLGVINAPERGVAASSYRVNFRSPDVPPREFSVAYGASAEVLANSDGRLNTLARQTQYKELGGGRWTWIPPAGCSGKAAFGCVWGNSASGDAEALRGLAARFAREANNDTYKAAMLAISYVQNFIYQLPKTAFGFLPPARTAALGRADCDSRSLLGVVLLTHLGVDAIMFQSSAHTHAMFGVALPASGTYKLYNGKKYYFVEATAPRPIGDLSVSNRYPDDWVIVPLRKY